MPVVVNTECYRQLGQIFDLLNPEIIAVLDRIDYLGYSKSTKDKRNGIGNEYVTNYFDATITPPIRREVFFGLDDTYDSYAYIYSVDNQYQMNSVNFPIVRETARLRLVLCSKRQDIEVEIRKIYRIMQAKLNVLNRGMSWDMTLNLNKEVILLQESNKTDLKFANNLVDVATIDFTFTYYHNYCTLP